MTSLALSVLLALVSAVCYAAGALIQERVAATSPDQPYAPVRRGSWWAAVVLNGVGALLHVAALAYGPLSAVQPLGALTIVFALPMAAVFVRRPVSTPAWRGAVTATAGLAGLLALIGPSPSHALQAHERAALSAVTVGAIAVLATAARWTRMRVVRGVLLAAAAGTAFGVASVFTKNVTVEWSLTPRTDGLPSLLMIGLLAVAGVLLSQASYRGSGLAAPLATATVANPVVATVVGVALLGERFRYGVPGTLLATTAAMVAAAGLVALCSRGDESSAVPHSAAGDEGGSERAGPDRDPEGDGAPGEPHPLGLTRRVLRRPGHLPEAQDLATSDPDAHGVAGPADAHQGRATAVLQPRG